MKLWVTAFTGGVVFLAVCLCGPSAADVFMRINKDGHVEFTDTPSGPGWTTYAGEAEGRSVLEFVMTADPAKLDQIIREVAERFEIDAALVKAIVKAESNSNPNAVSAKGAQGLMQLMPGTARSLNVCLPFDPKENVIGGVKYIKELLALHGDLRLALAAYNAGPRAVKKHAGIPPYRETVHYVRKVLKYYNEFKKQQQAKVVGR